MRILDRYVVREVMSPFAFGVAVFATFLLVNHLFLLARITLHQQLPPGTILHLLLLRIPYAVVFSLPMGLLLGTLLAFGRLSERNEVVAMRTSGISLLRVAGPVVVTAVLVAGLTILLAETVVPVSEDRHHRAFADATGAPRVAGSHILFREEVGERVSIFYARSFGEDASVLRHLTVNEFQGGRLRRVIEAEEARYRQGAGWAFLRGTLYVLDGPTTVRAAFARMAVDLQRTPREILLGRKDPSEMTIRELRAYIAVLRRASESVAQYVVWLHSRVAFPASAIIFALLAVPLGLRPYRGGTALGLGITVVILIGYYVLLNTTLALGQTERLPPVLAAWAPNLITGGVAGVLLWRAR